VWSSYLASFWLYRGNKFKRPLYFFFLGSAVLILTFNKWRKKSCPQVSLAVSVPGLVTPLSFLPFRFAFHFVLAISACALHIATAHTPRHSFSMTWNACLSAIDYWFYRSTSACALGPLSFRISHFQRNLRSLSDALAVPMPRPFAPHGLSWPT
jgi:hypothetical protein